MPQVKDGLRSDALKGAAQQLTQTFEFEKLVDLVVDTFLVVRKVAADSDTLSSYAEAFHADTAQPAPLPMMPVWDEATNSTVPGLRARTLPWNPTIVGEADEELLLLPLDPDPEAEGSSSGGRRSLLAATAGMPPGFVAAAASTLPKVLVGIIFHVMLYRYHYWLLYYREGGEGWEGKGGRGDGGGLGRSRALGRGEAGRVGV